MKTINITPTWEAAVKIYMACLENPKATKEAKDGARADILRLAKAFDKRGPASYDKP